MEEMFGYHTSDLTMHCLILVNVDGYYREEGIAILRHIYNSELIVELIDLFPYLQPLD